LLARNGRRAVEGDRPYTVSPCSALRPSGADNYGAPQARLPAVLNSPPVEGWREATGWLRRAPCRGAFQKRPVFPVRQTRITGNQGRFQTCPYGTWDTAGRRGRRPLRTGDRRANARSLCVRTFDLTRVSPFPVGARHAAPRPDIRAVI
jgi:hypothetical protein